MEEMAIGSGVYWYPTQKLKALAEGKTVGTMTAYLVDVMFDKNTLMVSNLAGGGNLGYKKLCPRIVQAITGMPFDCIILYKKILVIKGHTILRYFKSFWCKRSKIRSCYNQCV